MKVKAIGTATTVLLVLLLVCGSLLGGTAPAGPEAFGINHQQQTPLAKTATGDYVDYTLHYIWDAGDWSLQSRTTYTRDGQDRETQELDQSWSGGDWVNDSRTVTSYDGTGAVEAVNQNWVSNDWVNDSRSTYVNDGEQRPTTITNQTWDASDWVNESRTMITYHSGLLQAEAISQNWTGAIWADTLKTEFTYDGDNITQMVSSFKDGDSWSQALRSTYTYDGGLLATILTEIYFAIPPTPPDWTASTRTTNTYDNGLLTEQLFETYSLYLPPMGWNMTGRNTYEYDAQDRQTVSIYQMYSAATALDWLNTSRTESYYTPADVRQIDGVALPDRVSLDQNYPNPFNPATEIRFALTHSSHVTLDIYDVMGRKVQTLIDQTLPVGTHEVDFDGAGMASGVYFYRLSADGVVQTRKMLLLK